MSKSRVIATTLALGMIGFVPVAEARPADTGWVTFDLRIHDGDTYVFPRHSNGTSNYMFAGNCRFNALLLSDAADVHRMLLTAEEQKLRVSLGYDDADGPMCRITELLIEWAD